MLEVVLSMHRPKVSRSGYNISRRFACANDGARPANPALEGATINGNLSTPRD